MRTRLFFQRWLLLALLVGIALSATAQAQIAPPVAAVGADAPTVSAATAVPPAPQRRSLTPASSDQSAPSQMQWIDGNLQSHSYFRACWPEGAQTLTSESVGYYGATDASFPKVGDVYYMHVVVGVVGSSCVGSADVHTRVQLPAGTAFANTAQDRIRCWYHPASGNPPEEVTDVANAGCVQNPTQGVNGWSLGFRLVPNGGIFEIIFPVYSTRELHGIAQSDSKLQGAVEVTIASGWSFPYQWVFVAANPPEIKHPVPATTNVTATSAHGVGELWNHFTSGQVFFDIGTSAAYGTVSPPFAVSGEFFGYPTVFADWTGLQPATTYHWRMRYVTNGSTYTGPDQTFTTAAGTPTNVTVTLAPSANGSVAISPAGGSYAPGTVITLTASPASSHRFDSWTINGADGGTNNPRTLTVSANMTVGANFSFLDPNTLTHKVYLPGVVR
jgi:hypothetical protein